MLVRDPASSPRHTLKLGGGPRVPCLVAFGKSLPADRFHLTQPGVSRDSQRLAYLLYMGGEQLYRSWFLMAQCTYAEHKLSTGNQ